MKSVIKTIGFGILSGVLLAGIPLSSLAYNGYSGNEEPGWFSKTADLLVVRPVLFGATVAGSAVFVATSPITYGTGNGEAAAKTLVQNPAHATFQRCLGCSTDYSD